MDQRIAKAKELLNEAGYNEQNPLKFDLLYDTNESHKKIALAATSLWKKAIDFIDVNLTNQEWKSYLDSRSNGNYQMARARWCGDYNEASTFLNLLKSNNTNNWARYHSAEYDALMNQTLRAGLSDADRNKLYEQAEAILDKDHAHIDVFYYANVRLVKSRVGNYFNSDPLDLWRAKYWAINP